VGIAYWYRTGSGRSPVEEGIDELPCPDQAKVHAHIRILEEYGRRLGMPHVERIKGRLEQLRIAVSAGRYRIFFFFRAGDDVVLLHGFLKKTPRTPRKEIDTATERMNALLQLWQ
jgi:phage-related protein